MRAHVPGGYAEIGAIRTEGRRDVPQGLNVITGANGSGKSSLYRALRLLADTAQGSLIPSLAREGGLQSTLWAGPESISRSVKQGEFPVQGTKRDKPISLSLGFASDEFGYLIDLGLPAAGTTAFQLDPVVKQECVWHGPFPRPSTIVAERRGPVVRLRTQDDEWNVVTEALSFRPPVQWSTIQAPTVALFPLASIHGYNSHEGGAA